jgi:hypothetical protein
MRATSATEKLARVSDGSTKLPGSSAPAAGSQLSCTAKTIIRIRPNQYTGIETPNSVTNDTR